MLHLIEAHQAVKKLELSDNLVRATRVAQEFGISRVTLWRWERDGLLPPAYRINNRKYYPRTALDALKHAAAKPGGTRSASR
jgi:predicted DNA-binding transcriptional regulator AlpA